MTCYCQGEFASEGVQTHFDINGLDTYIKATSSGDKHKGLNYALVFNDVEELEPISNDFVESYPVQLANYNYYMFSINNYVIVVCVVYMCREY